MLSFFDESIHFNPFFSQVATSDVDDVREVLSYYRKFDDPIEAFRLKQNFFMKSFLAECLLTFRENQRKLEESSRLEEERKAKEKESSR